MPQVSGKYAEEKMCLLCLHLSANWHTVSDMLIYIRYQSGQRSKSTDLVDCGQDNHDNGDDELLISKTD